jgi:hypothetical protein
MSQLLTILSEQWYGWQMLPGYSGDYTPYYSPIYVESVAVLKTGKGLLRLRFFNAMYAEGVQGFSLELKVLDRHENYLIIRIVGNLHRNAVVSTIDFVWIKNHCTDLWYHRPSSHFEGLARSECQYYMNQVFFGRPRPTAEL